MEARPLLQALLSSEKGMAAYHDACAQLMAACFDGGWFSDHIRQA